MAEGLTINVDLNRTETVQGNDDHHRMKCTQTVGQNEELTVGVLGRRQ